jgi:hypothetical protein
MNTCIKMQAPSRNSKMIIILKRRNEQSNNDNSSFYFPFNYRDRVSNISLILLHNTMEISVKMTVLGTFCDNGQIIGEINYPRECSNKIPGMALAQARCPKGSTEMRSRLEMICKPQGDDNVMRTFVSGQKR